jgi:hypothetical protein
MYDSEYRTLGTLNYKLSALQMHILRSTSGTNNQKQTVRYEEMQPNAIWCM